GCQQGPCATSPLAVAQLPRELPLDLVCCRRDLTFCSRADLVYCRLDRLYCLPPSSVMAKKAPQAAAKKPAPVSDKRYAALLKDVQRLLTATQVAGNDQKLKAYWQLGERIARERLAQDSGYHNSVL